jgi:hypothetical protein
MHLRAGIAAVSCPGGIEVTVLGPSGIPGISEMEAAFYSEQCDAGDARRSTVAGC